ncbi:arabinan endo-1,5-alpha-L-arabinosidase [Aspergillus novofumigatus IBT 16806]|uniref:Arabinan endo-1,5-alpha-L-arabinosidase n=1 Tax=Aspergillus novofumigatus (strain IBT 16806) TaxID=1392255 RepID=A0A2I1BTJ7_ASPN1|nr:putative arabinan endo-1,5-alpha-L-arabinosidase A [Aspergillus novofumigatus IBT 16806]PKX88715.1 putative arabinan endo-1,5-alpha-L-arabinosidase A [Aspergillus novofumigatus IBT 16806]
MHPSAFVAVASCLAALAHGYANPGSCSGACNVHDPALIRRQSDGKYFRFSTGNKISYASSSSIQGPWTVLGSVLPSGSSINLDGNDDLWAPDVSLVNGVYHVYYSVSTFGSQSSAIGLATSSTMELNSWTDHGSTGIQSSSSKPYNAIDGNLFNDGGSYYMNFGSFWHDIYQAPMNSAATTVGSSSYNIAYNPSGTHAVEGAFMYKYGSYYYLFFSAGICCGYDTSRPASGEEYKIKVCRSTSATGNFVDASGVACTNGGGTVVLESHGTVYGPGGQGVFTDPSLGPILYYHYVDTTIGYADGQKRFGWNKIDFSSGWPVV